MATLIEFEGKRPTIGADVFLAPTAVLIGDVRVGDGANVWFGAVLRGDNSFIEIGPGCSIQDNTVVHCTEELPTVIESEVLVGHTALVEGCVIETGALIGMGAVVLNRARVGAGALIAAGAVVSEGTVIAPGVLAAGVPAREKKALSAGPPPAASGLAEYRALARRYGPQG
jgi:carbonic anhydrase/acetyltransferase-like protein (isoleucine patch superfamily)